MSTRILWVPAMLCIGMLGDVRNVHASEPCSAEGVTKTGEPCTNAEAKGQAEDKPMTGGLGGPCYGNATCNAGLDCVEGICHEQRTCQVGKVRNDDTAGQCCWPGQGWNGSACVGSPDCPDKHEVDKSGTGCQASPCDEGKIRMLDGVHCCWPGQAWVSSKQMCVGKPKHCPGDLVRSGESCVCEDGKVQAGKKCKLHESGMAFIPEGEFTMGYVFGHADEKPEHKVHLSAFYLDKYEVTADEYKLCVEAKACTEPIVAYGDYDKHYNYRAPGRGKHPINGVTHLQATEYCEWKGKRLPTEAEWEKAARGTDGRKYPWGNAKPTCARAMMAGCGGKTNTRKVGSKPKGVSPYGVYDMAGNVWEWTSDLYDGDYYENSPTRDPKGPSFGVDRVLRGGGGAIYHDSLRSVGRGYALDGSAPDNAGFRCALSLEKSTD